MYCYYSKSIFPENMRCESRKLAHNVIAMLEACIGEICAGEEEVAGIGKRGDHEKGRNMLNKWAQ